MKRICIFAGSDAGMHEEYSLAAKELAREIVHQDLELVYGAGKLGLMGVLADAVLEQGGKVIGIVPEGLTQKEILHDGLTELRIVSSMHERKAQMEKLASGFISLPGGIGTLEETCEMLTWTQLGMHKKPCGLLNIHGYHDHFIAFLDNMVDKEFFRPVHRSLLIVKDNPRQLLDDFKNYRPPDFKRWMRPNRSAP
uniref:Cytokinin riboside 5'-monophosphate phosphoribohydrolase n=1 Tax=Candidatus Kentrum sp. FW TaxID=2126338 RepID=A0A450TAB9_9GAMM|nr:MAG: hypothetical protein BECKFW1821C_GA0114237_100453 [Candidatus Kentron sp. FW]